MKRHEVWVVDDDASIRWVLGKAFEQAGLEVRTFEGAREIPGLLAGALPDAIVTDIRMPDVSGLALLDSIAERAPSLPVVIMTAHSDLESAVAAYRGGAFEYLPKPFDVDEAVTLTRRAIESRGHGSDEPDGAGDTGDTGIIGEAPAMQDVFRAIGRLSRSHINVLVCGESGTGKELVARALHRHSPRHGSPFIAINTAAIPAELLESELFGHEKGAFTGAQQQYRGRFEQAHGGTLFLDEIGDMPAPLQTRLLRVLADGRFYRVGGHDLIEVDVRIIAATNQDLVARVRDGAFREDLYHRLNVIGIRLPPLRERREDIPLLARHFLGRATAELGVEPKTLSPAVQQRLAVLDWPGNVRQVENLCRWLAVMAPGTGIDLADLPAELRGDGVAEEAPDWERGLREVAQSMLSRGDSAILDTLGPRFERIMLETALHHTRGHKQQAARRLGWGRNTLTRKLKELGMGSLLRRRSDPSAEKHA